MIGMGSSSRPKFDCQSGDQADLFMINYLDKWRRAMGNLNEFYLVGHSYGAYLAGTFACWYPKVVKKLILLSPLGLKIAPEGYKLENMRFRSNRGPPRWLKAVSKYAWGLVTPFSIARKLPMSRIRSVIGHYVRRV
jgi:pimeloyl-ACP methyl ester carboxylesterase